MKQKETNEDECYHRKMVKRHGQSFYKRKHEWSIDKILNLTSNSGNAVENK